MDVVNATVEAFNGRDLEQLFTLLDDQVELRPFAAKVSGETFVGHDGIRRWLAEVEDEWSEWSVHVDEQRALETCILSIGRIHARGRETGIEMDVPAAFLSRVQGGVLTSLESFGDPAEALAAADQG